MMGIGIAEGIIILLIAALFLRGDEFATAARTLGRWVGQAQRMSRSFMEELQREARDSGLDESAREFTKAISSSRSKSSGKPLESLLEKLEGPEEAQKDPAVIQRETTNSAATAEEEKSPRTRDDGPDETTDNP